VANKKNKHLHGFKKFIIHLAEANNINYVKTKGDEIADIITKLSDDNIEEDEIERLIISLERFNIIDSKGSLLLHYGYLKDYGFKEYIIKLAKDNNVTYHRTGLSELAGHITKLSGDDVEPDEIEKLAIALKKAKIISGKEMILLTGGYLNEY